MSSQVERLSAGSMPPSNTPAPRPISARSPAAAETAERGPARHRRAARRSHRPIRRTDTRHVAEPAQHRAGHAGPSDRHGYHAQPHAPHHFNVEGIHLYKCGVPWNSHLPGPDRPYCARHLPCHGTGETVRLTVSPDRVFDITPAGAVVSFVTPDDVSAVRTSFCNEVLLRLPRGRLPRSRLPAARRTPRCDRPTHHGRLGPGR